VVRVAIETFLETARKPVLIEPGEDPLEILPDKFVLGSRGGLCTLECWNETRNLVRRIRAISKTRRGFLELEVEHFGGRKGSLLLIDQAQASNTATSRRGGRLKYRELFRMSLRRQFSDWKLVELSTEPDLHHSLSPAYPRALLRRGAQGIAAIGAAEDALDPDGALTFGLIWLDYLRRRETRLSVGTLVLFVPIGAENTTCHRVRYLNPNAVKVRVFVHGSGILEEPVEPGDYTNFSTRLDPFCSPTANAELAGWIARVEAIDGVDRRDRPDGSVSMTVRGLEFARVSRSGLHFGIDQKHTVDVPNPRQLAEVEGLASGIARLRVASAADHANPLYRRHPEAWLESQVRGCVQRLDATIRDVPLYGQAPQFAAGDRGILDLLAADYDGRLVVIEVKASEDIHLPLQALDYWMRVKWHLERGEFEGRGYFPGITLRSDPPRLLLVAPALDFHPSNETVLRYFSPQILVERIGVGIEWRQELRLMFRAPSVSNPWPSQSFGRSGKPL
jgi:hypothetical protein